MKVSVVMQEKLDLLSGIVRNFSLDDFMVFKSKGITIVRDIDVMTDAEKCKLIDAITWQDDPANKSDAEK